MGEQFGQVQVDENGKRFLHHTSPSGIQLYRMCPRRWFSQEVLGLREPPGKPALFGIAGHKRIEHFLKGNQDVLTPLERLGVDRGHIPTPGPDLLVERKFKGGVEVDGIRLHGVIDLVNPRELGDGRLILTDWKFKGSLDWEATEEDLVNPETDAGIQMLAYAQWAHLNAASFSGLESVQLQHVTFQRPPKAKDCSETSIELELEKVDGLWAQVAKHTAGMREAASAEKATEVEAREGDSTCHAYNVACPFEKQCRSKTARFAALLKPKYEDKKMGLRDRKLAAAPEPTAAVVKPEPAPEPVKAELPSAGTRIQAVSAEQGHRYLIDGKLHTYLCVTGGKFSFVPDGTGAPTLLDASYWVYDAPQNQTLPQVLPPDAPKSDPALASKRPEAPQEVAKPAALPEVSPDPIVVPEPAQALPDVPKKRGRKLGSKNKTAEPEELPEVVAAAAELKASFEEAAQSAISEAVQNAPKVPYSDGVSDSTDSDITFKRYPPEPEVRLYFGCMPLGGSVRTLGEYVDGLERQVLVSFQQGSLLDIRLAQGNELGFGRWKPCLARAAQQYPPRPGYYVVIPGDERIDVVAQALIQVLPIGSVTVGR